MHGLHMYHQMKTVIILRYLFYSQYSHHLMKVQMIQSSIVYSFIYLNMGLKSIRMRENASLYSNYSWGYTPWPLLMELCAYSAYNFVPLVLNVCGYSTYWISFDIQQFRPPPPLANPGYAPESYQLWYVPNWLIADCIK